MSTRACSRGSPAGTRPSRARAWSRSPASRIAPAASPPRPPHPPGALPPLLAAGAGTGANIVDVSHVREGLDLHVRETAVELVLETRGQDHAEDVVGAMRAAGYETRVIR